MTTPAILSLISALGLSALVIWIHTIGPTTILRRFALRCWALADAIDAGKAQYAMTHGEIAARTGVR